jgi:RNA polymerase sigma factor (sigma-70 family)
LSRRIYNSDESLIAGFKAGDHDGVFSYICSNFKVMVINYVLKNSGSEEEAEDLFQEGVITLWEKLNSADFELTSQLSTYLMSICRFKWLNYLRDNKKEIGLSEEQEQLLVEEEFQDQGVVYSSRADLLAKCLNEIGESCKKILTMYYYMSNSMDDIAKEMGYTNSKNAKNQKYKCMKKLQTMATGS